MTEGGETEVAMSEGSPLANVSAGGWFGGIRPSDDAMRFVCPVLPQALIGNPARPLYFGGAVSGAVVTALERAFGRPAITFSGIFLKPVPVISELTIELAVFRQSGRFIQASATMRSDEEMLFGAIAVLGGAGGGERDSLLLMPDAPPPANCPSIRDPAYVHPGNLLDQLDRRLISEDTDRGRKLFWARRPMAEDSVSGFLALIADFVFDAFPASRGGASLDNVIRYTHGVPDEWYLCAAAVTVMGDTLMQGTVDIFTSNGALVAQASQSGLCPGARGRSKPEIAAASGSQTLSKSRDS